MNDLAVACPTCTKILGIETADLKPEVQVAEWDLFFSITKGQVLS